MKIFCIKVSVLTTLLCSFLYPQYYLNRKIAVSDEAGNQIVITVDSTIHENYGLKFPYTYKISISQGSSGLKAFRKFFNSMNWSQLPDKTVNDFFNGIDAVRFDYTSNIAYVSAAFHSVTDSLFIKITDNQNNNVLAGFAGICKYYDNRKAVVTCSADDWHMHFSNYFIESLIYFRQYNLWVTAGIVTDSGWCDNQTWQQIQTQLNLGFVEATSHSRNHLFVPYNNTEYEVQGSKEDIINNLNLPSLFKRGNKEYVYVWIAPYGQYNDSIDYYVSKNQYLTSRLTNNNYYIFSNWEDNKNKFAAVGVSYEMGEASWGGVHDLDTLNNTFNTVFEKGEIYHLMFHPHVLNQYNSWNDGYVIDHLQHISNRKNIWYVGLGHLYLYRLLEYDEPQVSVDDEIVLMPSYFFEQNYPNPFNPLTKIKYSIQNTECVTIKILDILGNEIETIVNEVKPVGTYEVTWNAANLPSGVYFYRIRAGSFIDTKKMIFLK